MDPRTLREHRLDRINMRGRIRDRKKSASDDALSRTSRKPDEMASRLLIRLSMLVDNNPKSNGGVKHDDCRRKNGTKRAPVCLIRVIDRIIVPCVHSVSDDVDRILPRTRLPFGAGVQIFRLFVSDAAQLCSRPAIRNMRRLDGKAKISETEAKSVPFSKIGTVQPSPQGHLCSFSSASPKQQGRLVMVSNRVADLSRDAQSGGLAIAIAETIRGKKCVWFGWSGNISDGLEAPKSAQKMIGEALIATIDLTAREYDGYYSGFANQCLWPILHYRPDLVKFDPSYFEQYRSVCRRFASALKEVVKPGDHIWVHDFHLMALGAELRRAGVEAPIGLFLHVPFPPREVLSALPRHQETVADLFDFDLVGFQTETDVKCFRRFAREALGAREETDSRMTLGDRTLVARDFPIGIDVDNFSKLAMQTDAQRLAARSKANDRAVIMGVDRLDYTKGLPERFEAYRRFLESYPEARAKTLFLQVTPPTRAHLETYGRIQRELDQLEGAIHGAFADVDWSPIRYVKRQLPRRRLAALYRTARIGLVTPLRDGMNLVAKEYVAAQDGRDPGVLILSRFAGAAEKMPDALIVNPHDIDEVACAIQRGLTMSLEERKARYERLLASIKRHDVYAWERAFLKTLASVSRCDDVFASKASAPQERPSQAHEWSSAEGRATAGAAE